MINLRFLFFCLVFHEGTEVSFDNNSSSRNDPLKSSSRWEHIESMFIFDKIFLIHISRCGSVLFLGL